MKVEILPKADVWRGRGKPRREIPENVRDIANSTYKTGNVATVEIGPGEDDDATELIKMLRAYARHLGRRIRIQRSGNTLRFELVDRPAKDTP